MYHSIILKSKGCGNRPKVQIAIKYSIVGFFQIVIETKLGKIHFTSLIQIQKQIYEKKFKSRIRRKKLLAYT